MDTGSRTALKRNFLLEHKSKTSLISSIAIDSAGGSVYLGLTDGQIEEHRIFPESLGYRAFLSARKHLGKKPLLDICLLETARRMAILLDGGVLLLDLESLEGQALAGAKGVTAIARQGKCTYPPRLAVALRTSKKDVRIMAFDILAGIDAASNFGSTAMCVLQTEIQQPVAIKSMAWVEDNLVFCTSLGYSIVHPQAGQAIQLFSLPESSISQTLVQELPGYNHAILLMDQVGIVIDSSGQPTSSALTFPSGPSALAAVDLFFLAVCTEAIHVYELSSSALIQSLYFPADQRPAPDQQLLANQNATGSRVVVAGFRKVWLYLPTALEDQAKQLLQAGNFSAALDLARRCSKQGAPWAQMAFAQAGFMLLQEGEFAEALEAMACCDASQLQPMELFPLFPQFTKPWAALLPAKKYWGLHEPLVPIEQGIAKKSGMSPLPASDLLDDQAKQRARAEETIARYFMEVRQREGIEALDGVDTLLVYLLSRQHMVAHLESIVGKHNNVVIDLVEKQLRSAGQMHALALLYASSGREADALSTWQGIVHSGKAYTNGSAHSQEEDAAAGSSGRERAVEHAAKLMSNPEAVDDALALRFLSWLLTVSSDHALAVTQARCLDQSEVLSLLRAHGGDVAWRYLEHLVWDKKKSAPALHTELGLLLIDCILEVLPAPDYSKPAWRRAKEFPTIGDVQNKREKLCQLLRESERYDRGIMRQRLVDSDLFEEQVIIHGKVGDTAAALAVLALILRDVHRAQALCEQIGGEESYLTLLEMLLHPPDGRSPLYADACRVLAAKGANLDPMRVAETLSEDMPIAYAADVLARMLRERIHRCRQGQINRNLQRALNLSASVERAEMMGKHIVIKEERACRICHTRLGNKMFAVYPNSVLACFKCASRNKPNICPLTGTDFLDA